MGAECHRFRSQWAPFLPSVVELFFPGLQGDPNLLKSLSCLTDS